MGIRLGANHYGKAETRVFRIVRDTDRHVVRDLNVSTSLSGDFAAAHLDGDQGHVLPTDTQKNTVFAFAKTLGIDEIESFGLALDHPGGGDRVAPGEQLSHHGGPEVTGSAGDQDGHAGSVSVWLRFYLGQTDGAANSDPHEVLRARPG